MKLFYHGTEHTAYLSHVKVQITASKKDVYLVLVYGITEHPMMLMTNRPIRSKEDALETAQLYFSRWRIEEYFCSKKDVLTMRIFGTEVKCNQCTEFLCWCLRGFSGANDHEKAANTLHCAVLSAADPIRKTVHFHYYRIAAGIRELLRHA